ncbi:MAG: NAD(P)H-quinone oxidoreductase [Deltaproteobacteria bacterium]|nr:NAD(P)H-quinone oxidoreductase [Deltaproteobacteria bacterium]
MLAVIADGVGGPEVLKVVERPVPSLGTGDALVRVKATAINRADILQRMGMYPAPPDAPADILGLEYAGVVEAVGDGVDRSWLGQRVMGIAGGGTYAQFVAVSAGTMMRIPDAMDFAHAAAVPEAFVTAHDALFTIGRCAAGHNVLIHAIGSGVGVAAVQLARAAGAKVFGTTRSPEKATRARLYGLDVALSPEHFDEEIRTQTDGHGADVVVDFVGATYLGRNVASLANHGTLVLVGLLSGAVGEVDLRLLLRRRARMEGTVLRSRSREEKAAASHAFEDFARGRLGEGLALRPVIDSVYALSEAVAAHKKMSSNESFGKMILRVDHAGE